MSVKTIDTSPVIHSNRLAPIPLSPNGGESGEGRVGVQAPFYDSNGFQPLESTTVTLWGKTNGNGTNKKIKTSSLTLWGTSERMVVLPDHTQLPDKDDTFVQNFQELPQSTLLTDTIFPRLQKLHADGQFAIGQDSGIYWRLPDSHEPLYKGSKAPDWFYIPNVPPMLDGKIRRSYVMWQEHVTPLIALEYVSGNGKKERDKRPRKGKFWVYEQAIQIPYYGIYEVEKASVEMYHLINGKYELMVANERGHYEIPEIGAEVGIWQGLYKNLYLPWLRWWDKDGILLLNPEEANVLAERQIEQERWAKESAQRQIEQERQAKEQERWAKESAQRQTEQERLAKESAQRQLELLAIKLRELGISPESVLTQ